MANHKMPPREEGGGGAGHVEPLQQCTCITLPPDILPILASLAAILCVYTRMLLV